MIDTQKIKEQTDLLSLAGADTVLRKAASTGGGEWAGPCPFCGGADRFRVQPYHPGGGIWLCRHCTEGKWQDAIEYGKRKWPGLPFDQVCERLVGGVAPQRNLGAQPKPARPPAPAYNPPPADWQAWAGQAVELCERNLWLPQGEPARRYLHSRGLKDETLRQWRLGFSPGAKIGQLWIAPGVVIPCRAAGEIWYLKVSLLPGVACKCERCGAQTPARKPCHQCGAVNKYRGVKGNRPAAIFGADDLPGASIALFVEGEFDALIAWQELHDVTAVCTLGSAANRPDLAVWGPYLIGVELILAAFDADEAGQRGLAMLQAMNERVRACPLPPGAKDINDFYLAGGALWPWFKQRLLGEEADGG